MIIKRLDKLEEIKSEKSELKQQIEDEIKLRIKKKFYDVFDFNYKINETQINTFEQLSFNIIQPFYNNERIFYRGERCDNPTRRLISTFLRNANDLFEDEDSIVVNIDSNFLEKFYSNLTPFSEIYNTTMGQINENNLYNVLAFAQHYLDISPLIDFTKNPYVALSFAIKNREELKEDIVIYTVQTIDEDDYTTNIKIANEWLSEYNVSVVRKKGDLKSFISTRGVDAILKGMPMLLPDEIEELESMVPKNTPSAKLIDIPTNDLMKYQHGVFLLLNDFSLLNYTYSTKEMRQDFRINKYVINKDLCKDISSLIQENAPYYKYDMLLNISKAVRHK